MQGTFGFVLRSWPCYQFFSSHGPASYQPAFQSALSQWALLILSHQTSWQLLPGPTPLLHRKKKKKCGLGVVSVRTVKVK